MNCWRQVQAALVGLAFLATALPTAGAERPNVLFIMGDDHTSHPRNGAEGLPPQHGRPYRLFAAPVEG